MPWRLRCALGGGVIREVTATRSAALERVDEQRSRRRRAEKPVCRSTGSRCTKVRGNRVLRAPTHVVVHAWPPPHPLLSPLTRAPPTRAAPSRRPPTQILVVSARFLGPARGHCWLSRKTPSAAAVGGKPGVRRQPVMQCPTHGARRGRELDDDAVGGCTPTMLAEFLRQKPIDESLR
jgi:hypothetical protein